MMRELVGMDVEMDEIMGSVSERKFEMSATRILKMVEAQPRRIKAAGPVLTLSRNQLRKVAKHIAALCIERTVNAKSTAKIQAVELGIVKSKKRGDAVVATWSTGSIDECAALRSGLIHTQGKISVLSGTSVNGIQQAGMEVSSYLEKKWKQYVSRDILSVTFRSVKMAEQYLYAPIWYKPNGVNPILIAQMVYPGNRTVFWDILKNEEYTGTELPRLNGQWYRYRFLGYTPAQARLNTCLLVNTIEKNEAGKYYINSERATAFMNEISLGATEIFAEAGLLTDKQVVQNNARPFQAMAGNKDFGSVSVWMLNGKFSITDGHDGTSVVTERHILAVLKEYFGIDLPEGSLVGLALQDRTGMDKAMTYIVSDWEMAQLCKAYKSRGMTFTAYGAETEIPELLSDRNSWKAAINSLADVHMNVMSVVHEISQPTLNVQLIAKLARSPYLDEIIKTCYKELINQYFGFLRGDKEATLADVSAEMGSQTLLRCFPEFAKQYSGVMRGAVSTAAESAFKKLIRFNLPMPDSKWKTFFGDVAAFLGFRVLGDHEVYCPWLKEGEKVVIVRFPSVHPREFFTAVAIGRETIMKRILALPLSVDERNLLMSMTSHMSESLIMTPNTEEFRTLTGGADYDTDKGIVSKWDVLVKAFEGLTPHAIKGGAAKTDSTAKRVYCLESSIYAFLKVIMSPKIGVVCNNLTAIIELIGMPAPVQIEKASAVIGNENGVADYQSHFKAVNLDRITDAIVAMCEQARADMKRANLNDDAIRAAVLEDCLVIAKTEVDRTIDAPKTGDDVKPLLNWLNRNGVMVDTDLFDGISMEMGKNGYEIKTTGKGRRGGRISNTRNALVDEFLMDINELISAKTEMGQSLSNLVSSEADTKVTKSMVALKMLYGAITGLRRMDMSQVATRDASVIQNKLKYSKAFFAAITNMGRMLAKEAGYDSVRLAKTALVASASKGHAYGKSIDNLFATTLFSPELMRLAVENYGGENTDYFEEVHAINNVVLVNGETLSVTAGFCYRGKAKVAVMEKRVKTGDYEVVIKEDGAYIKKSILDVFAIPEANGTFMVNISSKAIDENKGATNVVNLLDQADNVVVSTPFMKGQHNDCIILYKEGKEIARLGIAINGYALTKMLDCVSADLISVKNGMIDNNGVTRKAVVVLLNKNGIVDKGTIRKDEVHEEEDLSSLLNEYYVEEDCDLL